MKAVSEWGSRINEKSTKGYPSWNVSENSIEAAENSIVKAVGFGFQVCWAEPKPLLGSASGFEPDDPIQTVQTWVQKKHGERRRRGRDYSGLTSWRWSVRAVKVLFTCLSVCFATA